MIKVDCESCHAPYDLDERRLPPGGMKMRCPKCGASFHVSPDGTTAPAVAPAPPAGVPAPPPPAAMRKATMLGMAPAGAAAVKPPPPTGGMPAGAWGSAKKVDKPGDGSLPPKAAGAFSAHPKAPPPPAVAPPPPAKAPPHDEFGSFDDDALALAPARSQSRSTTGSVGGGADDYADLPGMKLNKPASPLGAKAATLVGNPAASDASFDDLDLAPASAAADGFGEVDLPAPAGRRPAPGFGDVDLPAPAHRKPASDFGDVDLPTPAVRKHAPDFGDVDLPAPASKKHAPDFGDIDLPVPAAQKSARGFGDIDLPAPTADKAAKKTAAGLGDFDLPVAVGKKGSTSFGDIDLPTPARSTSAASDEASFGDVDIGAPSQPKRPAVIDAEVSFSDLGLSDLPAPRNVADLPARKGQADLPGTKTKTAAASEVSFADLSFDDGPQLPVAKGRADLPQAKRPDMDGTAGVGSRASVAGLPSTSRLSDDSIPDFAVATPARQRSHDVGGDLDFGGGGSGSSSDTSDAGSGYGEVDIGGGGSGDAHDAGGSGEMEFGLPARDGEADIQIPEDILRRQRGETAPVTEVTAAKRALRLVVQLAVFLGVVTAVGAGLSLTNYGFFGMYYLERYLPAAGQPKAVRAAIERAEKAAATDTYQDVRRSLAILGRERLRAGLNRTLLTRSIAHESLAALRFGTDPASSARSAAIMSRLEERRFDAPAMELAFAGDLALRSELAGMAVHLAAARREAPKDPYVELLAGELALKQEQPKDALVAFTRAKELGGGARAEWGLARIALLGGDVDAQDAAVEATLKLSPLHVGARIGKARVLIARNQEQAALALLEQAIGTAPVNGKFLWSSNSEKADGFSVLGYVHEVRTRLHLARKAYADALGSDPYRLEALLGAGRVMLLERRYADGLTRFESALKIAEKKDATVLGGRHATVEAKLGIGRGLLLTARPQDAKEKLTALSAEFPRDPEILLWLGKADQDLGRSADAEASFRKAIELAPTSFDAYLALAQLYFNEDKNDDAAIILKDASKHVAETAEMRRMLGQSELKRNQLESAITEFQRALTLDPGDMDALFGMGIALRRHGRLSVAEQIFDRLEKQDKSYAGLPLERGLLFEARGQFDLAAKSYQEALKQEPENSNLLLRLGAAEVALGDVDAAERTLEIVIRAAPNSAEAEYFIGRVAFAREEIAESLTHFDRAVSLDGTVGEYHLYAGWAAMEMGNLGRTLEEVQAAIDADPSLGDAFWLRGVVRLRTGAVQDALLDVEHALELKPSRTEALAVMGDCYDQLRLLDRAISSYEKALRVESKRGHWWYRLGRLQLDAGHQAEGARALENATRIGDDESRTPAWLADSHRLRGEALEGLGNQRAAIPHYRRFLELAPDGAIDRRDVTKKMEKWGVELPDRRIH